jgi:hypothetical protein
MASFVGSYRDDRAELVLRSRSEELVAVEHLTLGEPVAVLEASEALPDEFDWGNAESVRMSCTQPKAAGGRVCRSPKSSTDLPTTRRHLLASGRRMAQPRRRRRPGRQDVHRHFQSRPGEGAVTAVDVRCARHRRKTEVLDRLILRGHQRGDRRLEARQLQTWRCRTHGEPTERGSGGVRVPHAWRGPTPAWRSSRRCPTVSTGAARRSCNSRCTNFPHWSTSAADIAGVIKEPAEHARTLIGFRVSAGSPRRCRRPRRIRPSWPSAPPTRRRSDYRGAV